MKAKELMIGDWVYSTFSTSPCQVLGMEVFSAESDYGRVYVTNVEEFKDINSLKPILLTPEILEKIGFVTKDEEDYWTGYRRFRLTDEKGKCLLSVRLYHTGSDCCEISLNSAPYWIKMEHLHQLQHLIRLSGIDKDIQL